MLAGCDRPTPPEPGATRTETAPKPGESPAGGLAESVGGAPRRTLDRAKEAAKALEDAGRKTDADVQKATE